MKVTTKPRGDAWYHGMFVHRDQEIEDSKHGDCGSPVRWQHLESVPAVVTDESAIATAKSVAHIYYCPKCDKLVRKKTVLYETSEA